MQKFTLIAACMALTVSGAQAAPDSQGAHARKLPKIFRSTLKKSDNLSKSNKAKTEKPNRAYALKAAEAAQLWCATTQKAYGWNGEEWELDETYDIQYDGNGQPVVRDITDFSGFITRETMTYNDNGMLSTRLTEEAESADDPFVESGKLSREYDTRVVNFITVNDQQMKYGDSWQPSNAYTQTVTRNEDGNVVLMERAVWFQGVYDPTYRLMIEYGEDGKASRIEESNLVYDYDTDDFVWQSGQVITDIVWDRTDGQILSIDDICFGSNRISSFTGIDEYGMEGSATVEYFEDGGYEAHLVAYDPIEDEDIDAWNVYTPLDENGSCKLENIVNYIYDGYPYFTDVTIETNVYDEYGLILLEEVKCGDGLMTWIEGRIEGEVEYDVNYGYPLTWMLSEYDPEEYELYPVFMAEYSDYIGLTGIDSVKDNGRSSEEAVYYDMHGHKVSNPASGLYIRRTGSKAEKILIR